MSVHADGRRRRRTPHERVTAAPRRARRSVVDRHHGYAARERALHGDRIVAVLDGGPGDVDIVDAALNECARPGHSLRLVHTYAVHGEGPVQLAADRAREYARGAVEVAARTAPVPVSAVCVPGGAGGALERELSAAHLLVAPASLVGRLVARLLGARGRARQCRVVGVAPTPPVPPEPDQLRLAYRLALVRELARTPNRPDGATTPEELDDAWHVGTASPPLSADVIDAWAACAAWPPPTAPDD